MVYHYGMYWGHSLLDGVGDSIAAALKRPLYALVSMLSKVLYQIWHLLAWIVNGIEKIFRNLAGLGENGDIVSDIVNNPKVSQIFRNMVGLATAIIIVFTIVKIIQDHYKEKDGGNPYKIVIRTFKGLLMFFFVNAAVVVGLYASGVMFRALDAATGTGSASIAGQAFKAMAAESNFMSLGRETGGFFDDVRNEYYWAPVASADTDKGRYFLLEFSGNNKKATGKALAARYAEKFPATQYGIVNDDGTVTPFANWLKTEGALDNQMDTPTSYSSENGSTSATAGYQNDLLRGIDCSITPSIDLTWSPIDIDNYPYSLKGTKTIEHNIQLLVMGSGVLIPMSTQLQKFFPGQRTTKSLEDSAKMFGINVSGGVSLQDGAASASFNMDETMGLDGGLPKWSEKFGNILTTILLNAVYTNTLMYVIQMIPEIPGAMTIGPVSISFVQILAPMLTGTIKNAVNNMFKSIIPLTEDGEPAIEMFSDGATDHNGAVWCIMNSKSNTLDTVIEQYRVDGNFSDLWGQLMANINELRAQLEQANKAAFIQAAEENQKTTNASNRIQEQQPWQSWLGVVNEYNNRASELLQRLGNLLKLHDEMLSDPIGSQGGASANTYLSNRGYSGDFSALKSDIKSTFVNLVALYQNNINGKRPTNSYADVIVTRPVYKPIVEFGITEAYASSLKESDSDFVSKVKDVLFGEGTKINLVMDTGLRYSNSNRAAYRVVDWEDSYGYMYIDANGGGLRNVADIYYEGQADAKNKSAAYTREQLQFMNMDRLQEKSTGKINWDKNGGVRYFAENNKGSSDSLLDNSYWGTDGVYVNGEQKYYYYEGTTYRPVKHGLDGATLDDDEVGDDESEDWYLHLNQNTVRLSTASVNETTSTAIKSQSNLIDELTTVDKSTSLAKNFGNEIVTFRKLGTAKDEDGKNDNKAKKSWIENHDKVKANGDFSTMAMTHNMTPNEIDDYMAGSVKGDRRYLIKTVEGVTEDAKADQSNWGDYIGEFTWQNVKSVGCLYNFPSMNYAVGFITIIAALGVYMNFAFALIQRAVNMAVLYMMSPITIAFYPFDDGSKFNSVFVKPFYNEAISAFAVIVSLNLFIVLMQPLESAVKNVAGTGMGWLALVAFVSMLPQVRNTVYSVLGGSKMSEKSLSDTFKAAKGAIGSSFSDFNNAKKKVVHGAEKIGQAALRAKGRAQAAQEQRMKALEEKEKSGTLNKFDKFMLSRKRAEEKAAKLKQDRIDQARDILNDPNVDAKFAKKKAMEIAGRGGYKAMNAQNKAAEAKAKSMLGKNATKEQIEAKKKELLGDANFKKSVNGVRAAKKVTKSLKPASSTSSFFKALGGAVRNTTVGEFVAGRYGMRGTLSQNKDSYIGLRNRFRDPKYQERYQKLGGIQYRDMQTLNTDITKIVEDKGAEAARNLTDGDNKVNQAARAKGAQAYLRNSGASVDEKLLGLKTHEYMAQGMTEQAARAKAQDDVEKAIRAGVVPQAYAQAGGDAKFAAGLAAGWKGLGMEMKSDATELLQAAAEMNATANSGSGAIENQLKQARENRTTVINQQAQQFVKAMGMDASDKTTVNTVATILGKANQTTSFDNIASSISKELNIDLSTVTGQIGGTIYGDFANKVQFDTSVKNLELALEASKNYAEAQKVVVGNLGMDASNVDVAAVLNMMRNVNDASLDSINTESLGYQMNKFLQEAGGNAQDATYIRKCAELKQQMLAQETIVIQDFVKQYAKDVRTFDTGKKMKEELGNAYSIKTLEPIRERMEWIVGRELNTSTGKVIVNDSKMQKMRASGDYFQLGNDLATAIRAVEQGDTATLTNSGFDESTVNYIRKGIANNDPQIQAMKDLASFYSENLFNGDNMGGSSMGALQSTATELIRMAENKAFANMFKGAAGSFGGHEDEARSVVDQLSRELGSKLKGSEWSEVLKGAIVNRDGQPIVDTDEFAKTVQWAINEAATKGESAFDDPIIAKLYQEMSDFRSTHQHEQSYRVMVDTVGEFERALNMGVRAVDQETAALLETQVAESMLSLDAKYIDKMKKALSEADK